MKVLLERIYKNIQAAYLQHFPLAKNTTTVVTTTVADTYKYYVRSRAT